MAYPFLLVLVAVTLFQESLLSGINEPRCIHNLSIAEVEDDQVQTSTCELVSAGDYSETIPSTWSCRSFQSALVTASRLGLNVSSTDNSSSGCITVTVPHGGQHYITEPVHFGNASVHFKGLHGPGGPPTIRCNFTVKVDLDRLFDPSYSYVNYTMNFHRSKLFSMDDLILISCPYPFRLEAVESVQIRNSTFRTFSEAVFDIFNSPNIFILDSDFVDNIGTGISRVSFRGNGGAVVIGFNNIGMGMGMDVPEPRVMVARCNFTNNRATAKSFFRTTSNSFFSRIFTGRGGGLGIFINESLHNITGIIMDNVFVNNYAKSFGGGLFMVIFGEGTQNVLLVERNIFENNLGEGGAGGLLMTFISNGIPGSPHITNVTDCSFRRNSGESGGAVLSYLSYEGDGTSFFKLERCNFTGNSGLGSVNDYGSAYGVWLVNNLRDRESIPPIEIRDCIFEGNNGTNGIVSIGYAPLSFHGTTVFRQNTGTSSLQVIGSLVDFYGYVEFADNKVGTSTALQLLSFSQMRLHSGLQILFTGNIGGYGASIFSSTQTSSKAFRALALNPQCFVLYEDPVIPPSQWNNVSVIFRKNEAILASSLYAATLDSCSWFSQSYPFFDQSYILKWPLWDLGNDSKNLGYHDIYDNRYQVETTAEIIETSPKKIVAWPGLTFNVALTGWDEFRNPTSVDARFTFRPNEDMDENLVVLFQPEIVIVDSSGENATLVTEFPLKYTISNGEALQTDKPIGTVDVNVLFESSQVIGDRFTLYADLCPGGYDLVSSESLECSCKEQAVMVLNCEDDQDSIIIESGYWVTTVPSNSLHRHVMNFYTCPPGYCRCSQNSSFGERNCVSLYINSDPDAQCDCNRHGILCGECREGQGVSALLDRCVTCSNASGLLILLLIMIDVMIFIIFILADKPLPATVYAFTFYIQIAPLVSLYFPVSFEVVGKYLYYVSSFLSFYFPYDFCLYENMSPLISYFIRLFPFLLATIVILFIYIIRKLGKLKLKWKWKLKYRGLWWIIIILYTPTVYTSMSILHCPYLVLSSGSELRWFVNGNVVCFHGGHSPLALLAIVVLVVCVGLVPLVFLISLGKLPKRLHRLQNLQLPLTESFKENFKWWSAVELGRRFIFILFIVLYPQEQAILLLLCIGLVLYGYIQPYRSFVANILEILVELNFLFLLLLVSSRILDKYDLFPPQGVSNRTDACDTYGKGVTSSTWILAPFYYFPLGLLIGTCIAYSIISLYRRRSKAKATKGEFNLEDNNFSDSTGYTLFPGTTTTQVIELSERPS